MKISTREKLLLTGMCAIMLAVVYCMFLLPPVLDNMKALNSKNEELESEIAEMEKVNSQSSDIIEKQKILNARINILTKNYFKDLEEENIVLVVDDLLAQSGVIGSNIALSDMESNDKKISLSKGMSIDDMNEIFAAASGESGSSFSKKSGIESSFSYVPILETSIAYKGNNDSLLNLITRIGEYDRKILIKEISISNADTLSGKIDLEFLSIPGTVEGDSEGWKLPITAGNSNPFSGGGMNTAYLNGMSTVRACDYIMTVKPITADLPTVVLGIDNADSDKSFIYADNPGVEDVEIHLVKKDGKYLCKYKTENSVYPSNSIGVPVPFATADDRIHMRIFSNSRTSIKDMSGIKLKLINETDKPFIVEVLNDDPNRPRIKITEKAGNILIQ